MANPTYELLPGVLLPVYQAKYSSKCTICRKPFEEGEWIARLDDKSHSTLRQLKIAKLIKKYAHVRCLPEPMPEDHRSQVQKVTESMMDLTDPQWPKDFMGFNKPDAGKAIRWLDSEADALGALVMARSLRKYFVTQLGGLCGSVGEIVNKAIKDTVINRKRKQKAFLTHYEKLQGKERSASSGGTPSSKADDVPTPEVVNESEVEERPDNRIHLAWEQRDEEQVVALHLDPPWVNKRHSLVKDRIKSFNASWDPIEKRWCMTIEDLVSGWHLIFKEEEDWDVTMDPEIKDQLMPLLKAQLSELVTPEEVGKKLKKVLTKGLAPFPFQLEGISFIQNNGGTGLIGDPMGVGKTIQAIGWLGINPEERPALIVVPTIVLRKWENEINKWMPNETCYRIRTGKDVIPEWASIILTTFGMVWRKGMERRLKRIDIKAVVVDECHYIKNYRAKRTKGFIDFLDDQGVKKLVALSGTPIVNKPAEFFTILHMLRPREYKSWNYYIKRYCGATYNGYGWDVGGATNVEELATRIRTLMIRRRKEDVLKDLPPKQRTILPLGLDKKTAKEYDGVVDDSYEKSGNHLAAITAARQWVGKYKVEAAFEVIKEYHNQSEPLVVFAHHQEVLDALCDKCDTLGARYGRIDGKVSPFRRSQITEDFQDGMLDVIFLGIKSGGVGIDLFRGSNVLMVERAWTPGDEEQAEDRCHRHGQRNYVYVQYLSVLGTVDSMMNDLIEKKRKVLHAVLDGAKNSVASESTDIREELLEQWEAQYGDKK